MFECRCYDGWDGIDCSLPLEKDCKDGKDNDKGSLMNVEKELKEKKGFLNHVFWNVKSFLGFLLVMRLAGLMTSPK